MIVETAVIDIPIGTLETLQVTYLNLGGAAVPGPFYLSEEYGVVKVGDMELFAINGVVSTEQASWSSVKALYR